jgi:hypothetical protein
MDKRPRVNSEGQKKLEEVQAQLDHVVENARAVDSVEQREFLPRREREEQTKLSSAEQRKNIIVLKPIKTLFAVGQKFDENFREDYNYDKQYVDFIYEHNEEKGSTLEIWTRPYPGVPAEFWLVPANKPVSGPRYLKNQIDNMTYITRKYVEQKSVGSDYAGQYVGALEVQNVEERASTKEVSKKVKIFMGS